MQDFYLLLGGICQHFWRLPWFDCITFFFLAQKLLLHEIDSRKWMISMYLYVVM